MANNPSPVGDVGLGPFSIVILTISHAIRYRNQRNNIYFNIYIYIVFIVFGYAYAVACLQKMWH